MPRIWGARTADERQAERRERIIRAAITVYGRHGYHRTSVKAVCVEAGLTERYFYESFSNNEDLLRQCFLVVDDDLFRKTRAAAQAVPNQAAPNQAAPSQAGAPDGIARARAALLVYLELIRANPDKARVFLIEMASVSPAAEALVLERLDRFGALLMEVLGADPRFARRPPPLLLRGVVGGGLYLVRAWAMSGFAEDIGTVAALNLQLYAALTTPGCDLPGRDHGPEPKLQQGPRP